MVLWGVQDCDLSFVLPLVVAVSAMFVQACVSVAVADTGSQGQAVHGRWLEAAHSLVHDATLH